MRIVSIQRILQLLFVASLACLTGCAMCANPFDCDYAAYGSRLPRADMAHGRVGSILDGSSAGIVTTQPIYEDGGFLEGEVFSEAEVFYGESQPFESNSNEIFESPSPSQPIPAQEQIERVYETIEGEIRN